MIKNLNEHLYKNLDRNSVGLKIPAAVPECDPVSSVDLVEKNRVIIMTVKSKEYKIP